MSTSTSQDLRCPRCDAHVRAGSEWCALCFYDVRPAPQPPEPAAPGRGRHARATAAAITETTGTSGATVPDAEVELMLAQLAAESGVPLGRLAGFVDSPGRKTALMIGGGVGLAVVVFLLMALVGVLL